MNASHYNKDFADFNSQEFYEVIYNYSPYFTHEWTEA